MVKCIFIFFILLHLKVSPQGYIPYYNSANEAEYLFHTGQFVSAEKTLLTLKDQFVELRPREQFYLGMIYYYLKDTVNGFKSVELSIQNFLCDGEALEYYLRPRGENLISEYARKKLDSIRYTMETVIDDIRNKSDFGDSLKYFLEMDQLNRKDMSKFQQQTDDNVQKRFLNFIKREGIPDPLIFGEAFTIIFFHVTNEIIYKEYDAYLFDQLIKGNFCPSDYALFADRRIDNNGNRVRSKYGSFQKDLIDADVLKKNRESIGLSIYCPRCDCNFPNYTRMFVEK